MRKGLGGTRYLIGGGRKKEELRTIQEKVGKGKTFGGWGVVEGRRNFLKKNIEWASL